MAAVSAAVQARRDLFTLSRVPTNDTTHHPHLQTVTREQNHRWGTLREFMLTTAVQTAVHIYTCTYVGTQDGSRFGDVFFLWRDVYALQVQSTCTLYIPP